MNPKTALHALALANSGARKTKGTTPKAQPTMLAMRDGTIYARTAKGNLVRTTPRRVKSDPDSHHNATRRRTRA